MGKNEYEEKVITQAVGKGWMLPAVVSLIGFTAALIFMKLFPPVVGLGTAVRLPVFHGALTWSNLVLFVAMAVVGMVAFIRQTESWDRWAYSTRLTAIALWLVGSFLGLIAASISWDFTATAQSPIVLFIQEPRMRLQFAVLLLGIAVLCVPLVTDSKRAAAATDVFFGIGTLILLAVVMGQSNALHPDSPVMSSDDLRIKLPFYAMFVAQLVMCAGIIAWVRSVTINKGN